MAGMEANPMLAMLANFWDSPMAAQIAFHPQPAAKEPDTAAHRDGELSVAGGEAQIGYRLFLPTGGGAACEGAVLCWHGNAELCTDMGSEAATFHAAKFAVLSIDYRGFGWSTGQPSLKKLCKDAEDCFQGSEAVLSGAGIRGSRRVLFGRSIGATCAVHIASLPKYRADVAGVIIDSGLMSVKELPMAAMMAGMLGPQGPTLWQNLPEPFDTYGKLADVQCPALVMHGKRDEIVPIAQGVTCGERLTASVDKKVVQWDTAGHNDVLMYCGDRWRAEVGTLLAAAGKGADGAYLYDPRVLVEGQVVETHSLSSAAWNGLRGAVAGRQNERVQVRLDDPPSGEPGSTKALRAANLRAVGGPPAASPPRHRDPDGGGGGAATAGAAKAGPDTPLPASAEELRALRGVAQQWLRRIDAAIAALPD